MIELSDGQHHLLVCAGRKEDVGKAVGIVQQGRQGAGPGKRRGKAHSVRVRSVGPGGLRLQCKACTLAHPVGLGLEHVVDHGGAFSWWFVEETKALVQGGFS